METKSVVRQHIDRLLNMGAVLEHLEGSALSIGTYLNVDLNSITIWPDTEHEARRLVGHMIRQFGSKPKISKWSADKLQATFTISNVVIHVINYKGRKCAVIKRTIVHEAEPEKVIPAKAAYVEEVEELVCEMPSVEAELSEEAEAAAVPF